MTCVITCHGSIFEVITRRRCAERSYRLIQSDIATKGFSPRDNIVCRADVTCMNCTKKHIH